MAEQLLLSALLSQFGILRSPVPKVQFLNLSLEQDGPPKCRIPKQSVQILVQLVAYHQSVIVICVYVFKIAHFTVLQII